LLEINPPLFNNFNKTTQLSQVASKTDVCFEKRPLTLGDSQMCGKSVTKSTFQKQITHLNTSQRDRQQRADRRHPSERCYAKLNHRTT
jgi:hypothetical protein